MQLSTLVWGTTLILTPQANADFWAVDYYEGFQEGFKFVKDPPQCTASLHNAVLYPQYPDISGGKKGCVYIQIGDQPSLFKCNTDELGSFTFDRARDNNLYDASGHMKGSCVANLSWEFDCQFGPVEFHHGYSILNCTSQDLKIE